MLQLKVLYMIYMEGLLVFFFKILLLQITQTKYKNKKIKS